MVDYRWLALAGIEDGGERDAMKDDGQGEARKGEEESEAGKGNKVWRKAGQDGQQGSEKERWGTGQTRFGETRREDWTTRLRQ